MAEVIYVDPDALRPMVADNMPWLFIEEQDGMFFGSGGSWKPCGEWVGYGSLSENDVSLQLALEAAQEWATRYNVPTIWVFASSKAAAR